MTRSKARERNLVQHRDKTDEEFEEYWKTQVLNHLPSDDFEKRIEIKLREFSDDYDIDDLKINDKAILRSLIQSIISLEDYEQISFKLRYENVSPTSISLTKELNKIMSDLRSDISRMQDDLAIKRKIRKSDREASVLGEIEELKKKARAFAESKMAYILCPKCGMLISTWWLLWPMEHNTITLTCHRKLEDGKECGEKVKLTSEELYKNKGTNRQDLVPEALL